MRLLQLYIRVLYIFPRVNGYLSDDMKVAVTYENGEVFQHFGRTEQFKIYDIENGKIVSSQVVGNNGESHGGLINVLISNNVEALICGGIGGGAKAMFASQGIKLYPGASGQADDCVNALISDSLSFDPNTECHHHDEEGGEHTCTCGHGH